MNGNNKVLKELVKYVREQRKINLELRQANLRQEKMNINFEKRLQMEYALFVKQNKEVEILKEWLKNHEVRLRSLEK